MHPCLWYSKLKIQTIWQRMFSNLNIPHSTVYWEKLTWDRVIAILNLAFSLVLDRFWFSWTIGWQKYHDNIWLLQVVKNLSITSKSLFSHWNVSWAYKLSQGYLDEGFYSDGIWLILHLIYSPNLATCEVSLCRILEMKIIGFIFRPQNRLEWLKGGPRWHNGLKLS